MFSASVDTAVNVLLALTCVVVLAKYTHDWWRETTPRPNGPAAGLRTGERVNGLEGQVWPERSLLVFVRSNCHFCTQSMGLYRDLRERAHEAGTQFIAVGQEPKDVIGEYLRSNGVTPDEVLSAPPARTRVFATPTVAIVDSKGTVLQVWVGKLSPDAETNVKAMLARRQ